MLNPPTFNRTPTPPPPAIPAGVTKPTTPATPAAPTAEEKPRRKATTKQALARIDQQMEAMTKRKAALQKQKEREDLEENAAKGRMIFLAAVEGLHPGERGLVVDPVLPKLPEDKRALVQAWMTLLASE